MNTYAIRPLLYVPTTLTSVTPCKRAGISNINSANCILHQTKTKTIMMKINQKLYSLFKETSKLFRPGVNISISSYNRLALKCYSSSVEEICKYTKDICLHIVSTTMTSIRLNAYDLLATATTGSNGNLIQMKDFQNEQVIAAEKYGSITIISLNRPKHKNAITKDMATKLTEAIETFENDDTSNVGILQGVGGNFSAGLDLDELREDIQRPERFVGDDGFAVTGFASKYHRTFSATANIDML